MKIIVGFICSLALMLCLGANAKAAYEPDVDYSAQMAEAVTAEDDDAGIAAQQARDEKIDDLKLDVKKYSYEDLKLLSKIIYAEAGCEWLDEEWKMHVGEVVLNRVESPEFPDTIKEVLEQPGQYYGKNSSYFNSLVPSEACVRAALRLLNGERLLEPAVVFQANFKQGSGVHTARYDEQLGWSYFCFSSNPGLYDDQEEAAQVSVTSIGGKEPM